jgi:hypothetical protein
MDVRIGGSRGPGVVIDTEGRGSRDRDRDCRKVTITKWELGACAQQPQATQQALLSGLRCRAEVRGV